MTAPAKTPDRFEVLRCGFDWGVYDNEQARWVRNYVGPTSRQDADRALPRVREHADIQERQRAARTPERGSR
jgi:hypothetical protein